MARTPSNMLALKTKAPEFKLLAPADNKQYTLEALKGENGTVVFFICNHCPFVIHVLDEIIRLHNDYEDKGICFVAINPNDVVNYPDDSPEKMIKLIGDYSLPFPYLFDDTQEIAKAYDAACTPDNFVFGSDLKLTYRGQLDGARPGNDILSDGVDIRHALDCLINGKENKNAQKPSIGCNIKWKP